MEDLPTTINELYLQRFGLLKDENQKVLVTVLRWLICRGDRIELQPIADELAEKDNPEQSSNNGASDFPSLRDVAKHLTEIGRDFLKVTNTTVQLDHNSVRDFIESIGDNTHLASNKCASCGRTNPAGNLAQAAGKEGKLIIAEYMLQTINSEGFQETFILFDKHKSHSEVKGSQKPPTSKMQTMRYEVSHWYKHLRAAEAAWESRQGASSERWEALYASAERFLSQDSQVYQDWLIRRGSGRGWETRSSSPYGCSIRIGRSHQTLPRARM